MASPLFGGVIMLVVYRPNYDEDRIFVLTYLGYFTNYIFEI